MKEISKKYEAGKYEENIYKLWEKSGFFNPDNINSKKKYSNILPPPNANGGLHLGHASGYTVMDIFGRFERMKGKSVLLLPGKDHAGIQTQVVYEKKLEDEQGINRNDLGRKKFFQSIYDFCLERANYMRSQEKKIGVSADWSREKFTLDTEVSKIAMETFVKMHKDGMIYQGERIINWCPRCKTALSDIEVDHKTVQGKIYFIKYPIQNSEKFITVATTRPETMLGDSAVAVNSQDERYTKLVGLKVILPLENRIIPIIADKRIDKEFGTGAVKITPAHDLLDWDIGQDHQLPIIQVINEKAQITKQGGKYQGQDVLVARKNILADLKMQGFFEKEEDLEINKSICERCKETIEPLISKQWFVAVDAKKYSLKKEALKAIKNGEIKFFPENFRKTMIQWLSNLHDWCISRQIWWGHQIPVWYCEKCGEEEYIVSIEKPLACPKCQGKKLRQETDTFDTWFSSGQWVHTTLGYPQGKDFKEFYPTDMMIMGRDLLFFWASRMIMMSLYRTGEVPFKNLFFTGLIRDKLGKKMSKSKGNGIDPLQMIDKYGVDALRLSLVMDTTPGQDSRLYEEKIEGFRNFITKLWNIYRYSTTASPEFFLKEKIASRDVKSVADQWIIAKLNETIESVTIFMEKKEISLAQEKLKKFTWDDLADWYLEIHKIEKNNQVLGYLLDKILKLWHPFTPFVTEKIWQDFWQGEKMLMMEKWVKPEKKLEIKKAQELFEEIKEVISKVRNLRANYRIDPAKIVQAYSIKIKEQKIIEKLARIEIIEKLASTKSIQIITKNVELSLDIANLIDIAKEKKRTKKEIEQLNQLIVKIKNLLANKKFKDSAPEKVILQNQKKLKEYQEKIKTQKELLMNITKF